MACGPLRVEFRHGPPSRTWPQSPAARAPPWPHRCFFLLWWQTPPPPRPPPWRHRPSRSTHHLLLSNRHLPRPQRRPLSPLLGLLPLPPLVHCCPTKSRGEVLTIGIAFLRCWYIVSAFQPSNEDAP